MTSSLFCRKCVSVGAGLSWLAVSKIGPSIPPSSTSQNLHMGSSNAFVIVVIALAVSALLCLCMFILIFRRSPAPEVATAATANPTDEPLRFAAVTPKNGLSDEASGGGSKWSAPSVELVVMAGEDGPTFLAHPAPAHSKANVIAIECPPLQL